MGCSYINNQSSSSETSGEHQQHPKAGQPLIIEKFSTSPSFPLPSIPFQLFCIYEQNCGWQRHRDKRLNASCASSKLLWDLEKLITVGFTCIPQISFVWQYLTIVAEIPLQYRAWQTHLGTAHLVQT